VCGQANKGKAKAPPSVAASLESQAAAGMSSKAGSSGDGGAEALMAHLLSKAKFEGGPWDEQEASPCEKFTSACVCVGYALARACASACACVYSPPL
jgi:hypothetical protein